MSLKITTTFAVRRPTLIRVWRATGKPGSPLTSVWMPTLSAPTRLTPEEGGSRL